LGGIFVVFSMLLLGTLQPSFSFKDVVLRMLIFGIGGGLFETSNAVIVLGSAPKHRRGIASGVLAMVRNAGMVFGIAISSALTGLRQEYHLKGLSSLADQAHDIAAIRGIKDIFLLASACALVCVVISIMGASSTKVKKEIVN
ncbi:MAG: hypothetical protein PHE70_02485, partial [Tepidanaerobacteraceae bacterium]|nr:hypothetical protein [Tepidanaerobacteraceae bacterium]